MNEDLTNVRDVGIALAVFAVAIMIVTQILCVQTRAELKKELESVYLYDLRVLAQATRDLRNAIDECRGQDKVRQYIVSPPPQPQ